MLEKIHRFGGVMRMNLTKEGVVSMPSHQRVLAERGVSERIAITHLNSPTIFESQNGQLGSVIKIEGIPFDTASNDTLNSARRTWHHAISLLDDSFFVMVHTIRRRLDVQLEGRFDNEFCREVDSQYHKKFNSAALYSNDIYLTIIYKGFDSGKVGQVSQVIRRLSNKTIKNARESWRKEAVEKLVKATTQLETTLARFDARLLGGSDTASGSSELLSFLALPINGAEFIPFKFPQGHVGQYLPSKRIFFGRKYIELQRGDGSSRFGAILSIKRYPDVSASVILDKLMHLDAEFISTHSFSPLSQAEAAKKVELQFTKLENSNDNANSQMTDLLECQDDLASGRYQAGNHHHSLLLLADDLKTLKKNITQSIKMYADSGIVAFHDLLGQQPLFWAQLPCNQSLIVRAGFITSKNFVDFSPLHNYRTGYRDKNHLGSAVSLIETPSKTPMFFNYHQKGSGNKNDLTPGHATIIGGNGSGKTVFECFMDAQMSRYGGRSFFFDRDRGTEIYVRACNGVYSIISPNHPSDVQFNPFCLDDTPQNRQFLKAWMGELVRAVGEVEIPADIDSALSSCVDYAYDSLSSEHRHLLNVTKMLPVDFPRWSRLEKWLEGGDYAYLFNHSIDSLDLDASKMGFDLTELMKQPASVTTAVMMYLFHRLELSLDGSRVSVYLAEGWQYLNHPYWIKKLTTWLPTLRKLNCHIVLDTQSPKSVVTSQVSAEYLDNSACSIFFCNDKADKTIYSNFNITEAEYSFIKNTPKEKRLFLYKQGHESCVCKLDLSGMAHILSVLSGNKGTVDYLSKLRQEVGDDPRQWLPIFYEWRKLEEC